MPGSPADSDGIGALLSWAKNHPAAVIRNKAARIRSDLYKLTARREADDAQREAEERVAKLKAELEQAQETLRAVKAGGRPLPPAVTPAPTDTKRSKERLAAIRTWARAQSCPARPRTPTRPRPAQQDPARRLGARLKSPRFRAGLLLIRFAPALASRSRDGRPSRRGPGCATAASMLNNGDNPEQVREALGLSESELAVSPAWNCGLPMPWRAFRSIR
ncbi:hypothetical protein ACFV2U_28655 [Streptomyces sp. NPDC059697]|uniref:hypothetical protein n=1 Tax=Streptomyces sp. NPDC059697 TaxID=3346912 RepID=UPI00367E78E5